MLTDTHCHIQTRQFDRDRDEVLRRAAEAGVDTLVCVGYDPETWRHAQELASAPLPSQWERPGEGTPRMYASAGLHPHDAKEFTPELLAEIRGLAEARKIVAIGECGLDFFRNLSTPEQQRDVFTAQIDLAAELGLPLIVHDRDAHESVLELLRAHGASRGVMHCFSGDWAFAQECLGLGFYLSIAGPVTYPKSDALREVAARAPLERLVLETDCPYLTPQAFRGQRNEPALVRLVADEVARVRGIPVEALAEQTSANAGQLFGI